jgi:hypothetical protein
LRALCASDGSGEGLCFCNLFFSPTMFDCYAAVEPSIRSRACRRSPPRVWRARWGTRGPRRSAGRASCRACATVAPARYVFDGDAHRDHRAGRSAHGTGRAARARGAEAEERTGAVHTARTSTRRVLRAWPRAATATAATLDCVRCGCGLRTAGGGLVGCWWARTCCVHVRWGWQDTTWEQLPPGARGSRCAVLVDAVAGDGLGPTPCSEVPRPSRTAPPFPPVP